MTSNIYMVFSNILLLNRESFENSNRQVLLSYLKDNRFEEYLEVFVCPENRADMRLLIFFLDKYLPMWRDATYKDSSYLHIKDDEYRDMQYIYYGIVNLELHASKIQGIDLSNERYIEEKSSLNSSDVTLFCKDFNINDDLSIIPLGGFARDMKNKKKLLQKCVVLSFYFDVIGRLKIMFDGLDVKNNLIEADTFKRIYPCLSKIIDSNVFKGDKNLFVLLCFNSYLLSNKVKLEDLIVVYYELLPLFRKKVGDNVDLSILKLQ